MGYTSYFSILLVYFILFFFFLAPYKSIMRFVICMHQGFLFFFFFVFRVLARKISLQHEYHNVDIGRDSFIAGKSYTS